MDRRDRIALKALEFAGTSPCPDKDASGKFVFDRVAEYCQVGARPADLAGNAGAVPDYYMTNKQLSTCALFAVGVLRLLGCEEPECVAPYLGPKGQGVLRDAFVDLEQLAARYGAWRPALAAGAAFGRGDVFTIVDDSGKDAHMGVCVADAKAMADRLYVVDTVEGGQLDEQGGSRAIRRFTRSWRRVGGRLMLGARHLYGYADAGSMPVADVNDPVPGQAGA